MAKVLLIQPHQDIFCKEAKKREDAPLNLLFLASFIQEKHQVKIYDRNIHPKDEDLISLLEEFSPQIVGLTSMTSLMLHDIIKIGNLIKLKNKEITIIVGGTHATIEPQSLLNEPYVDYVLRGEGEEAFLEFCNLFDKDKSKLSKIKNINLNPMRPLIEMNNLILPDYSLIEIEKYQHFYVTLSRGCIGNCTFCSNHLMWGKEGQPFVRMFGLEKSLEMLDNLINKYHIKKFSLVDDNFLTFKSRVKLICNYLEGKNISFFCFGRADCINDEILKYLKKAGCHSLQIGIESGSPRILKFLEKQTTIQQNMDAIACVERNGITCDCSVMTGIAGETKEDLEMTFNLIKKINPTCPDAQIFNPMPGTPIFDYCLKNNLIKKPTTLKEWADWTGDWTPESGVNHNVSKMSDDYIIKITKDIKNYHLVSNKIKRTIFWIKKGDINQLFQSSILFLRQKLT